MDTVLGHAIREVLHRPDVSLVRKGVKLGSVRVVPCAGISRQPRVGLTHQPWWLSSEEYQKHRQWCGETFGWGYPSYSLHGGRVSLQAPQAYQALCNRLQERLTSNR